MKNVILLDETRIELVALAGNMAGCGKPRVCGKVENCGAGVTDNENYTHTLITTDKWLMHEY